MLALARKYRPKNFSSVAVQSHVSNTLKGAIARGRVAHGYLLCGPRGVGKTTLARVLAMALNCERRLAGEDTDGEPCGECSSCTRIWSGSASLDVVEIDAASNRGVDDARELRERAMYAPSGDDRYKVYIVDEAHMLTREAWNALLKVLEEPPPRVVFVFATTEPQKIAQAAAPVLSRLQRFDFKRIGPAEIRARLEFVLGDEQVAAEPEALNMISRAADGSMRDALSLTDQVMSLGAGDITTTRVREALGLVPEDEYLGILDIIAGRRAGEVFSTVGRLADAGVDFGSFLAGLADVLRAQLAVALGGAATDVSERMREQLAARRDTLSAGDLLRMLTSITELEPRFRKSGQQQLLLETLLVRFALLDRTVTLEEVLRGLGGPPPGGAAVTAPAPRGASATLAPPRRESAAPLTPPVTREPAPPAPRRDPPAEPRAPRAESTRPEGTRPRAESAKPIAQIPQPTAQSPQPSIPDINRVAEAWGAIVDEVARHRPLFAETLRPAEPAAVSASGVLTLDIEVAAGALEQAIEGNRADLLAALAHRFPGITRVQVRAPERATPAPIKRMTTEGVMAERLTSLRKRDPVLDAAVDKLDLDLVE